MDSFLNKQTTTAIKGIAILLVVISHVGHGGFGIRLFVPLGCFGVAVFLILSGYGLMESYQCNGLVKFWRKRLLRVLIPYLIWIVLYVLFMSMVARTIEPSDLRYWFVEYLIIWYVAFYFILRFFAKTKWTLFLLVAVILFYLKPCLEAQQSMSFIVGVFMSYKKDLLFNMSRSTILKIGLLCCFIGLLAFGCRQWMLLVANDIPVNSIGDLFVTRNIPNDAIGAKVIQIITKLPIAIFVIVICTLFINKLKWSYSVGLVSYELYLVHFPLYIMIAGDWLRFLLFMCEIIVLSFVLYRINIKMVGYISKITDFH